MSNSDERTIGQILKEARQQHKWSIDQAAHNTRLHRDIITRIEEDRYDLLPSHAYVRGFVRLYAKALDLDDLDILKQLDGVVNEQMDWTDLRAEMLETLPVKSRKRPKAVQLIGLAIIFIIVAGGLLFGGLQLYRIWPALAESKAESKSSRLNNLTVAVNDKGVPIKRVEEGQEIRRAEAIKAPEEENQVLRAEAVTPVNTVNHLRLSAAQDCWARVVIIQDNKETIVFENIILAGSTMPASEQEAWAGPAFNVTLKDASLVDIIYNDENYGKYDGTGKVQFRIPSPSN